MTVSPRFSSFFKFLALASVFAAASNVNAAKSEEGDAIQDPWAFNLSLYMWFQGVDGDFSARSRSDSISLSFIDIAGKMSSFPMAFNGHFEAHYERLGFYLDGNYLGLDFHPHFDRISKGSSLELGVMDYGVSYRLFGSPASEGIAHWDEKSRTNILDIYAGGRTLWLGTEVDFKGIGSSSGSASFSAPLIVAGLWQNSCRGGSFCWTAMLAGSVWIM
jgi:hypothetical protein